MARHTVCPLAKLPPGEVAVLDGPQRVAVFNVDGELYAVEDRCTHQDAWLSDGFVEGVAVECPLHASLFDLRTGEPSGPPAVRPVRTFPVRVEDGDVVVDT
ncbi:bifunctional 3-phenylpropionate/cinnamic acid dioxygenase ferredoxin subunit [Dactylosporangium sp. CA-092794]|uniref:bifunctional 3-phenylpropionate/cinnamic acid dioxygenase ferredoxin subunit n=1 Tax=Dactylosporangium sp. CA-092794 TaxID=3239929 RepID=UPI003D9287FD